MRFVGNVLWFVLGGWYLALIWIVGGLVFAFTVIGIPLTRAAFEMMKLSAFPFGKEVVHVRELDGKELSVTTAMTGTVGLVFNVLWMLTFGWVLFISYIFAGVLSFLTIILIPFGIQSFKLAGLSLWPVGRRVVAKEMAQILRKRVAEKKLAEMSKNINTSELTEKTTTN